MWAGGEHPLTHCKPYVKRICLLILDSKLADFCRPRPLLGPFFSTIRNIWTRVIYHLRRSTSSAPWAWASTGWTWCAGSWRSAVPLCDRPGSAAINYCRSQTFIFQVVNQNWTSRKFCQHNLQLRSKTVYGLYGFEPSPISAIAMPILWIGI